MLYPAATGLLPSGRRGIGAASSQFSPRTDGQPSGRGRGTSRTGRARSTAADARLGIRGSRVAARRSRATARGSSQDLSVGLAARFQPASLLKSNRTILFCPPYRGFLRSVHPRWLLLLSVGIYILFLILKLVLSSDWPHEFRTLSIAAPLPPLTADEPAPVASVPVNQRRPQQRAAVLTFLLCGGATPGAAAVALRRGGEFLPVDLDRRAHRRMRCSLLAVMFLLLLGVGRGAGHHARAANAVVVAPGVCSRLLRRVWCFSSSPLSQVHDASPFLSVEPPLSAKAKAFRPAAERRWTARRSRRAAAACVAGAENTSTDGTSCTCGPCPSLGQGSHPGGCIRKKFQDDEASVVYMDEQVSCQDFFFCSPLMHSLPLIAPSLFFLSLSFLIMISISLFSPYVYLPIWSAIVNLIVVFQVWHRAQARFHYWAFFS